MNANALVGQWRVRLNLVAVGVAALHALGSAGVVHGVARYLGSSSVQAAWLGAVVALATFTWRGHRAGLGRLTRERVALWLEERAPSLQYALLGALAGSPMCELEVQRTPVGPAAWRGLRRPILRALASAVIGVGAMGWTPGRAVHEPGSRSPAAAGDLMGLGAVRVRVLPPAYTRRAVEEYLAPDVLRPLAGSRVEVTGEGVTPAALLDRDSLGVRVTTGGWIAAFVADTAARLLRIDRDGASRLVVIDPVLDAPPRVVLELPRGDAVVRMSPEAMELRATFSDDFGLQRTHFEYIVTSGSGEMFTSRTGELAPQAAGAAAVTRSLAWPIAPLNLQPGDVIHLRAVARDGRGGLGASESRSLRLLRTGDDDSLAVDAAPPAEVDAPLLSQRMLINLTEALLRRERGLAPASVRAEAVRIGRDQGRLRRQVSDLIFTRLGDDPAGEHFHGDGHDHGADAGVQRPLTPEEIVRAADRATGTRGALLDATHDESPVLAVSRPLLEAYNAMWEAGRLLESGSPRAALPPMFVALAAIQKARSAERLYLRGARRAVVVDLARVRLTGRERGTDHVTAHAPSPLPPPGRKVWDRIVGALSRGDASDAVDSLLIIRVESTGAPSTVAALDSLVAVIRRSEDVSRVLLVLRARLGAPSSPGPASPWRPLP